MTNTIIYVENDNNIEKVWDEDQLKTCVGYPLSDVHYNNADIAVLCDKYPYMLRKEKYFAHLKQVMVPMNFKSLASLYTFGLRYLVRNIVKREKVVEDDKLLGRKQKFMVLSVHPKKDRITERDFYPASWTSMDMLKKIDELGIDYILIRWPEKVLKNEPMKDIDVLVADTDAPKLRALLRQYTGTKPIDVHTIHGGEVGRGDTIAYFPPKIAQNMIKNRIKISDDGGYAPCLEDQFKSLAYHAVFNKGINSRLAEDCDSKTPSKGKIYNELKRLEEILDIKVPLTLQGLLDYIKHIDWMPPSDMIAKKSQKNTWLKKALHLEQDLTAGLKSSYFVFIMRDIANEWGIIEEFTSLIEQAKFKILYNAPLTDEQKQNATSHIRGGNWGNGLCKTAGGFPCHLILVEDNFPTKPNKKERKKEPAIINTRVCLKREWRDMINNRLPKEKQANFVHTSDNSLETIDYLNHIDPELVKLLK